MWPCPKCGERIEPPFELCWRCGVDRAGIADPHFQAVSELEPAAESEAELRQYWPFQFRLKHLFLLMAAVGILLAAVKVDNEAVWIAIIATAVVNLLGAIAGLVVTHILGLPNDGSSPSSDDEP